jgi:plasmid stabilization system protein ParE
MIPDFHRLASKEYRRARDHYRRISPKLGQAFVDEIDAAVQRILTAPDSWPIFRAAYRWIRVRRFPYVLYFRKVATDRILIMAVAHGRRRTGYWLRRARLP